MDPTFMTQTSLTASITRSISTGVPVLDIIITTLVGFLVTMLFTNGKAWLAKLWTRVPAVVQQKGYSVVIESVTTYNRHGRVSDDRLYGANPELLDAIRSYLSSSGDSANAAEYSCKLDYGQGNALKDTRRKVYTPLSTIALSGQYCGLEVVSAQTSESKGESSTVTDKITIKGQSRKEIEEFIQECHKKHLQIVAPGKVDLTRYLYMKQDRHGKYFLEIPLFSNKTMDSLFIDAKQKILEMYQRLERKEIQKLNLLLHGPPGTGKTSLIKALVNLSGRHVFYIKLSEIDNIQDAIKLFYEQDISVIHNDGGSCKTIPLNKRILVLEDIDVESSLVHSRDKPPKIITKSDGSTVESEATPIRFGLTLADILQLFDGIIEPPQGQIIIMTTNNIEKLDPAFKRPGRITMTICLDKMSQKCAMDMIQHFFSTNTHTDPAWFGIKDRMITPAHLESLCQQAGTVEDLQAFLTKPF